MSPKLQHPFNYYWKKYIDGECPFCGEESELKTFENLEIVYCSIYGGYLSIYQDAAIAGVDGYCKQCRPIDPIQDAGHYSAELVEDTSPYRELIDGQGFLCENCGHGVYFDKKKTFQELFKRHNEKNCPHCTWHNKHSPGNPVEKPRN